MEKDGRKNIKARAEKGGVGTKVRAEKSGAGAKVREERNGRDGPIGIFDSGVGGLKVLEAVRRRLPAEDIVYVFDRSHSPYGSRGAGYVRRRAEQIAALLEGLGAKAIVVACNTATCVAIDALRARCSVPVVGTEPPIKPAAEHSRGGKILVLATPLTVSTERFGALVSRYDRGNIIVSACRDLAAAIEDAFPDTDTLGGLVDALLAPFDGLGIESVVLGCTHYYFVRNLIESHYSRLAKHGEIYPERTFPNDKNSDENKQQNNQNAHMGCENAYMGCENAYMGCEKSACKENDEENAVKIYSAESAVAERLASLLADKTATESGTKGRSKFGNGTETVRKQESGDKTKPFVPGRVRYIYL